MADVVPREVRSRMMAGIRGKNTRPEIIIRKGLHALGFRYRIHDKRLPGEPDLVFLKYNAVILVHGCFWHGHDCELFKWPKTRRKFWRDKIGGTRKRDMRNRQALIDLGWRVLEIWECTMKGRQRLCLEELIALVSGWLRSGEPSRELRSHD